MREGDSSCKITSKIGEMIFKSGRSRISKPQKLMGRSIFGTAVPKTRISSGNFQRTFASFLFWYSHCKVLSFPIKSRSQV
jgi:hypothetical protein